MTVLRIGYALLLLTVLGLDAFCGSILSAAATACTKTLLATSTSRFLKAA